MYFAICTGMSSRYMHPSQQRKRRDFPIAVIPAENVDHLVSILGGEKVSSFENEHEIFLSRKLFSWGGKYSPYNFSYDFGPIHLEIEHGDGLTLWAKEVPVIEKELAKTT